MDALIKFSTHLPRSDNIDGERLKVGVLDTKFVTQLMKLYSKFSKSGNPLEFIFPSVFVAAVVSDDDTERVKLYIEADFIYLLLNFDKKHWVGLCIDMFSWKILVLD